jgi:hypothetical protein
MKQRKREAGAHGALQPRTATSPSAILALLVAIVIAFSMESMEQAKQDPQFAGQLELHTSAGG